MRWDSRSSPSSSTQRMDLGACAMVFCECSRARMVCLDSERDRATTTICAGLTIFSLQGTRVPRRSRRPWRRSGSCPCLLCRSPVSCKSSSALFAGSRRFGSPHCQHSPVACVARSVESCPGCDGWCYRRCCFQQSPRDRQRAVVSDRSLRSSAGSSLGCRAARIDGRVGIASSCQPSAFARATRDQLTAKRLPSLADSRQPAALAEC